MSDEIINIETCLSCGKHLKDNTSEFCESCEKELDEESFSYFPGEALLKDYFTKIQNKVNLRKYNRENIITMAIGLVGLTIYFIATISISIDLMNSYGFYLYFPFYFPLWLNIFIIVFGIIGSFYLNINSKIGSIILLIIGVVLVLCTAEFWPFIDPIWSLFQYIGSFIVFAAGVTGFSYDY